MVDMTTREIERMLEGSLIGRLCMADAGGAPYSIPLPFCWLDGSLYLRLPLTGRKGAILTGNDRVCFEVDQFSDDLSDYASVLVEGRLVEVTDLRERAAVKSVNNAKYALLRRGNRPGHGRATPLAELPMRKIVACRVSGKKKDEPAAAAVA